METKPEQTNPTVFGNLDLKERLPAPHFNKQQCVELCHLWEKIPGLRESIEGKTKTQALSQIILELSEYRVNGPAADNTKVVELNKQLEDANATIESHEATILKIKYEHEDALKIANSSLKEKGEQADNEIATLTQKLEKAEKLISSLQQKEEDTKLADNQVVVTVLPELLQKTRNPEVYKLMLQRGYINSNDNSPSTLYNLALKEFLRVFFGI